MASLAAQTYGTHRRYDPLWHFFGAPIVIAGFIAATVHAVRHESNWNWWFAAYTFGVVVCVWRARAQTQIVQNRLIRLEMHLRLKALLAPALGARIGELTVSQLIGLRFASDAELPGLVERCLNGLLAGAEAVKKEVKNWQADWLRA